MIDTAPQGLRCTAEPDRERVTVRAAGEIDLATVPVLDGALADLRGSGFAQIAVDLRAVTFMDSTGLKLLVRWRRRAQAEGFALRIEVEPSGPVHRVMELTCLDGLLLSPA